MATLRDAVRNYQDELRDGIAWVIFWRNGHSWKSDSIFLEMDDTVSLEDKILLQKIQAEDPVAVVLNGYYCGCLGDNMTLAELTAGVRYHYENRYNGIVSFMDAHCW